MATTTTFIWVAAGTAGCTHDIDLLPASRDSGAGGAAAGAGGAGGSNVGSRECAGGMGLPIRFPTSTGSACTSALVARGHRFGVCTCDALDLSSSLRVDSVTSDPNATSLIAGAAAVGTNGPLSISSSGADIRIGGSLYVANGVVTTGHIEVGRALRVASSMIILGTEVHVAADAYVGAAISGTLRVDGVLHQTPGFGMDPMLVPESSIRRETIAVAPPCDCSASFVDLPQAVADGIARNDNAISVPPVAPDSFKSLPEGNFSEVTCGTFMLSSIDAGDQLVFFVHGRAEVVVAGDVVLRGGMAVLLDDGAEFDLLIGGRLVASGGAPITTNAPARFRIWIAGTESVVLDDAPPIAAQLHAPRAAVVASTGLQFQGGLLARSISAGGLVEVHLDQAVFSSGMPCGEPIATPVQ